MKNKTLLIGLVVLIVIAAGAYLAINRGSIPMMQTSGGTTLKALLATNSSQKCTFTSSTADSSNSGDVYVAAGKLRGDFSSVAAGKTTTSHLIVSNDIAYVWIDQPSQGFRMSFDSMNGGKNGSPDANANVDYKCQPWGAVETQFTLPSGVNFQDVNAMMQNAASTSPAASAAVKASAGASTGTAPKSQTYAEQQCAACNMVTDAGAKAQCKAAFDCR